MSRRLSPNTRPECFYVSFWGSCFYGDFLIPPFSKNFWFNWNFLLMEFRWANNFLFLKNWLVTFSSCLSSASFAIKVECFVLRYHFTNFALIDFWCFVRGVLLFWHCSITDMYIFRLMLLIFCSWKTNHLGFVFPLEVY